MAAIRRLARIVPFLILFLLTAGVAPAADPPATLRVEPERIDVTITPGQPSVGRLAVTNPGQSPVTFQLYAADRRIRPGGRVDVMRGLRLPTSAAHWVTFPLAAEEVLMPGERKEYEWRVNLPEGAVGPGDYTALLLAEVMALGAVPPVNPERQEALLVVTVPGVAANGGKISDFGSAPDKIVFVPGVSSIIPQVALTLPRWLRRPQPLHASFSFVNSGGSTVRAAGSLVVESGGKPVVTIPAGIASEVFPGDAADFHGTWPNPPIVGQFKVIARVDTGAPRSADDSLTVFVFPWPYAVAAVLLAVLAAGSGVWIHRRRDSQEFEDFSYLPESRRAAQGSQEIDWSAIRPSGLPSRRRAWTIDADSGPADMPMDETREPAAGATRPALPPFFQRPLLEGEGIGPFPASGRPLSPEMERLLGSGLAAVQLGANAEAYQYFSAAAKEDEECIEAWLFMAGTTPSVQESEECLRRVLALDPNNAWAVHGLRLLGETPRPSSSP